MSASASLSMPTQRRYGRLSTLILGANPKTRGTVMLSMYAAGVYLASLGLLAYSVHFGLMAQNVGSWIALGVIATVLAIYAMLRSGWSMRFKDPTLTLLQMGLSISWDYLNYAAMGPAHVGMLLFVVLSLFFGIFSLDVRGARFVLGYALIAGGGTMLYMSATNPEVYQPSQQFIYFVALLLVTSMMARLATRLTGLRRELEAQRSGLATALGHIQEASARDPLTGLYNRRHMMEMLNHEVQRNARFNTGFSLALIDLDHFKQINDRHGHHTGDAALCCFARQAQAALRPGDVLARWGGEEFMLLCPESSTQDVLTNLEFLRNGLRTTSVSEQHPALRVRFSAGLTLFTTGETIGQTIDRADQALYAAKAQGRDRCEIRTEAQA